MTDDDLAAFERGRAFADDTLDDAHAMQSTAPIEMEINAMISRGRLSSLENGYISRFADAANAAGIDREIAGNFLVSAVRHGLDAVHGHPSNRDTLKHIITTAYRGSQH